MMLAANLVVVVVLAAALCCCCTATATTALVADVAVPARSSNNNNNSNHNITFDVKFHQRMMNYTWSSFCDPAVIMNNTCAFCSDPDFHAVGTLHDSVTEAYGYVGYNAKQGWIILGFRGSSNLDNWLADFDFIKVKYNDTDAKVHAGFFAAWSGVRAAATGHVANILASKCPHCSRIITTGHSLGSAISGLASLDLALEYGNNSKVAVEMHNFGMPRVGDAAFASIFKRAVPYSTRVVHRNDIVPHLPLQGMGFHHVATEVWDQSPQTESPPNAQTYKVCDGSGEDPTCSDSVPILEWHPKDHDYYMGTTNHYCHYDH
ncbi:hypothetical protein PTSG_03985 [Salpingoeca rosetta]|uniref:Fungal lipase-type domain-containing protein n=1 Tax=Salpingoeca rosetta (strain ATCC 50818 / BSB-021) TaxID=946362 RepID=F2U7G2_SALR5|nr:uncharacterized protein PTSG_03985 [Salpingoeca rosetta]EGD83379.1 hypothetical protein PTSG_03985 [Salpingoeca rosetta]|eukprot:XP_004994883.1 hypothetical protein PTSG_03985 [Salpingoeca rosetta]